MENFNCSEEVDPNVPRLGMNFTSVDEAKTYYNNYARGIGFSIRINKSAKNSAGIFRAVDYTCSKEGEYLKINTPKKKRDETRCGCTAAFSIRLSEGKYVCVKFEENHNHELVPDHAYLLRSQRNITDKQKHMMSEMREAGIGASQAISYMSQIVGGPRNLGFTKPDGNNFFQQSRKKLLQNGDVNSLQKWFLKMKRQDPHFLYEFWLDKEAVVQGVFFCDGRSRREYHLFGDAVVFDTTFNTNTYNMVCAPIVGVNNHWQTTLFGCGLLVGETIDAVKWLLSTFLQAMEGKHPETIFTDQSAAIGNAVRHVLPNTNHRLCLWHIYQNIAVNLGSVISTYKKFSSDLKRCIYFPECEHEFEELWMKMLAEYHLEDNTWLQNLYSKRHHWALVYGRAYFCAGMTTTQRSESTNSFLKEYFTTTTILSEFGPAYTKAMLNRREEVNIAEFRNKDKRPTLLTPWRVEIEASKFYTLKMFSMFQVEVNRSAEYDFSMVNPVGSTYTFKVCHLDYPDSRNRTVEYDISDNSISCSCRKFEFQGLLCAHALRVFRKLRVSSLPQKYYLNRWSRAISTEIFITPMGEIICDDVDESVAAVYSELTHKSQKIVAQSVGSKKRVGVVRNSFEELAETIGSMKLDDEEPTNNEDDEDQIHMLDPKGKQVTGKDERRKKGALEKGRRKSTKKTGETSRPSDNMANAPPQPSFHDLNVLVNAPPHIIFHNPNALNAHAPPPYQVSWNTSMNYGVNPWNQTPNNYAPPLQAPWNSNMNYEYQSQDPTYVGTQESQPVVRNLFQDYSESTQYNDGEF